MKSLAEVKGARMVRVMVMAGMLAAAALAVAVTMAAQEQKKDTKAGGSATKEELIKLENEWVEALTKPDVDALDGILADTYTDGDEGGNRTDKKAVLAALKSGDLKIASIKLSDVRVYNYGDAAVVTGTAEQSGSFKGQALAGKVIFTDAFVKRSGKWRAVSSHRSARS